MTNQKKKKEENLRWSRTVSPQSGRVPEVPFSRFMATITTESSH